MPLPEQCEAAAMVLAIGMPGQARLAGELAGEQAVERALHPSSKHAAIAAGSRQAIFAA